MNPARGLTTVCRSLVSQRIRTREGSLSFVKVRFIKSNKTMEESNKSTEEFDKEEIASILKSCIVSHKGGIPQEELDDAYFKCTGHFIPYLALGYPSLYQYMRTFTDIVKERNENKVLVYKVLTPKTAHIASLVERQKDSVPSARYTKINKNRTRVVNSNVCSNNFNGNEDHPTTNWKRKATNEGRRGRRAEKRRKDDERTRLRNWNQIYDRSSSSEEGNHGNCPWDISNSEGWYADEYNRQVKIMEKPAKMDVICEPIVGGKQLIGDDFFLQLAIRNAGMPVWRKGPCTALHSGLCISGQTIKDCTRTLKKVQVLSNRLVIMLGAEDIYRDHSSDKMIEDMEDLLEYLEARYSFSRSAITLCTIPPLANLSMDCDRAKLAVLHRFNSWIREQTNYRYNSDQWDSTLRYNLIEFYNQNTIVQIKTNYEYFQLDARMVSGSPHPYVLWNVRGRRLAMNLLRTCH